jgi:hypothetical protein
MKKKFIALFAIVATALLIFSSTSTIGYLTGAPSGKANDPSSGNSNCTSCHSGTATSNATIGNITTNIPATGYVPGTTYTITANVVYAGKTRFGFEVSPQNTAGTLKGTITITDPTNTKIVSTKYVTHTSAGNTGTGSRSWSFNWTAPAAGTGVVGFYGAFLVGNNNGSESGDLTYKTSITVLEASPCTISATITSPDTICTLDTVTLVASSTPTAASYLWNTSSTTQIATGGSGTYTVTVTAPGGCTATATKTVYATPLKAPTGIVVSTIKGTSATLTWTKASCATGYTLQYRPVGTTTWKTVQLADTAQKNLTALLPLTTYELQMLSKIGTAVSTYSTLKNFTTICLCNPETPIVTAPTSTSQTFTWTDDACGVRYKLQYRKSTVTAWTTKIVGDTLLSTTLSNLALNTTYNYQFRRECNVGGTYYSTWVTGTFTTPVSIVTSTNELSKGVVLTKITDVFGREVDVNYKDMVIYYYSDGSTKKGFIVK